MNKKGEVLESFDKSGKAEELHIEDLVSQQLERADKKLELVDNSKINEALEDYVNKQQARALDELLGDVLGKHQEKLIRKKREQSDSEEDDEEDEEASPAQKGKTTTKRKSKALTASSRDGGPRGKKGSDDDVSMNDDDDYEDREDSFRGRGSAKATGTKRGGRSAASAKASSRSRKANASLDEDDEEVENDIDSSNRKSRSRSSPRRRGTKVPNYKEDDVDSSGDDHEDGLSSDEVQEVEPPRKRGARSQKASVPKKDAASRSKRESAARNVIELDDDDDFDTSQDRGTGRSDSKHVTKRMSTNTSNSKRSNNCGNRSFSQSQLSFQPVSSSTPRGGRNKNAKKQKNDNEDSTAYDLDEDWGTATTNSMMS